MALANMPIRVAGHSLYSEGWPWIGSNIPGTHRSGPGMARCECGEMSEALPSVAARKRWHKQHKLDVITQSPGQ